jgi:shikimate dehydrogenase
MSCESEQYPAFLKSVFTPTNVRDAIITMPHKVRRARDGRLQGDLFAGEGFVLRFPRDHRGGVALGRADRLLK